MAALGEPLDLSFALAATTPCTEKADPRPYPPARGLLVPQHLARCHLAPLQHRRCQVPRGFLALRRKGSVRTPQNRRPHTMSGLRPGPPPPSLGLDSAESCKALGEGPTSGAVVEAGVFQSTFGLGGLQPPWSTAAGDRARSQRPQPQCPQPSGHTSVDTSGQGSS